MNRLLVLAALALTFVVSPSFAEEPKERSEVPAEFKWDLSSMYVSDEAWEADKRKFESMLPEIAAHRNY